ncbi:hypothetical protein TIFTF001_021965 [Ficus carica]|uniref:RNase H type-1 domain-containing protein n=1 Tax=Ficus carica TaxID=3494 RepID=A0AA88AGW7_FICCA|nr:hypothetical protein TIFTF001_021965 [Ficus carica]
MYGELFMMLSQQCSHSLSVELRWTSFARYVEMIWRTLAMCFGIVSKLRSDEMGVFFTIIWRLWQRRNKWIFENKMMNANDIVAWAGKFLGDFLVCNELDNPLEKKTLAPKVLWQAPSHDQIKINVDAAVDSSLEYIGIGVVARDKDGAVMSFLSRRIFGKFSPHLGECLAVREGVCLANFLRLDNWVVESDALNTVSAIQNPVAEAPEANIVEDIRDSLSVAKSVMKKVPKGWDKLFVSIVSVETGKYVAKSGKATVQNGSCRWEETLLESIWMSPDNVNAPKNTKQCLVKFVVIMVRSLSDLVMKG